MLDILSSFGNILSCKVVTDCEGHSKGFGFVHFENEEVALNAIKKVNGMMLNGKKLFVGRFIRRNERKKEHGKEDKKFTNVYVKNLSEETTADDLPSMFSKFGTITSHKIAQEPSGKSRCFGFVAFEEAESAEKACEELNGTDYNGKVLYVGRAQKKTERVTELRKKFEDEKIELIRSTYGANLYIKNLDDSIDDDMLRKKFTCFGKITSVKVMMENGRSKGFGFVCFSNAEEASRAIIEMNGCILGAKPLYVALAQRREDRRAHLNSQDMQRVSGMRMAHPGNQVYQANHHRYYMQTNYPEGAHTYFNPIALVQRDPSATRWTTPNAHVRGAAPEGYSVPAYRNAVQARPQHAPRAMPAQGQRQMMPPIQVPNMAMMPGANIPRAVPAAMGNCCSASCAQF